MARPTPGDLIQAALEPGLKGGIAANRTARVLKALTDAGYVVTDLDTIQDHEMSSAARDVLAERRRQVEAEGWTPMHDDGHSLGELGLAAALYALPYDARVGGEPLIEQDHHIGLDMALEIACGWRLKPDTDPRRRLVKAGALILAEIERRDRAAPAASSDQEGGR